MHHNVDLFQVTGKHKSIDDTHLCDSLIHEKGYRFEGRSLEQQRSDNWRMAESQR